MQHKFKCITSLTATEVPMQHKFKFNTSSNATQVQMHYKSKCNTSSNATPVQMQHKFKCNTNHQTQSTDPTGTYRIHTDTDSIQNLCRTQTGPIQNPNRIHGCHQDPYRTHTKSKQIQNPIEYIESIQNPYGYSIHTECTQI